MFFSNLDAYLNIVGGLKLEEPAVDLSVAMALVSSLRDVPLSDNMVIFGEVGLSGEIRSIPPFFLPKKVLYPAFSRIAPLPFPN